MDKEVYNKIIEEINKLEEIPLYDVHGGRQRDSGENERLVKLKIILEKLEVEKTNVE